MSGSSSRWRVFTLIDELEYLATGDDWNELSEWLLRHAPNSDLAAYVAAFRDHCYRASKCLELIERPLTDVARGIEGDDGLEDAARRARGWTP